jgi:hypothetical protein
LALASSTGDRTHEVTDLIAIDELPLVQQIFDDQLLVSRVGIPPSVTDKFDYRLCVRPEALGLPTNSFGDCDALVIQQRAYERSSAVQFKRVKISDASFMTGQMNKLRELPKAVLQANEMHAVGFATVWLTVLVVTDLRSLSDASARRFTPRALIDGVTSAIPLTKLHKDVGVTVCEITQIFSDPVRWRGGSGGTLVQHAVERSQPRALTDAIATLFSFALSSRGDR